MSEPDPEALKQWAESRSLAWQPEDTLPPITERLRRGLGVGEHRSSIRSVRDSGILVTEKQKKRPERQTLGVCEGQLPGGLQGELGHHVYLTDQGRGLSDNEPRYIASVSTVVFAELPFRARPVFHLQGNKAADGGGVKPLATIGGKKSAETNPLDGVVPAPQGIEEAGGMRWTTFPAENPERIRAIASGSTRFLEGLPDDRIKVEYECGILAIWVEGRAVVDGGALDQLCRFASKLATDLTEVTDSSAGLQVDQPLPLPEPDARAEWVQAGAELVEWDRPPVSILAAQERYKKDVNPRAARTGWKIYAIVATVIFLASVLVALAALGISFLTNELPFGLAVMIAAISVAGGGLAANRIGLQAGKEVMEERINASVIPWGIEAFAQGYAEVGGLTVEDHEELRRRLAVPFNGRAQVAWQGELTPGVPGHLSVWIDPTDAPDPPRFYLLAVTAADGKKAPSGYESLEEDGLRLTWQEVTSVQRATHRLDQLRQAATSADSV